MNYLPLPVNSTDNPREAVKDHRSALQTGPQATAQEQHANNKALHLALSACCIQYMLYAACMCLHDDVFVHGQVFFAYRCTRAIVIHWYWWLIKMHKLQGVSLSLQVVYHVLCLAGMLSIACIEEFPLCSSCCFTWSTSCWVSSTQNPCRCMHLYVLCVCACRFSVSACQHVCIVFVYVCSTHRRP